MNIRDYNFRIIKIKEKDFIKTKIKIHIFYKK